MLQNAHSAEVDWQRLVHLDRSDSNNRVLQKVDLVTGNSIQLATGNITQFDVVGQSVYFTQIGTGSVVSLRRFDGSNNILIASSMNLMIGQTNWNSAGLAFTSGGTLQFIANSSTTPVVVKNIDAKIAQAKLVGQNVYLVTNSGEWWFSDGTDAGTMLNSIPSNLSPQSLQICQRHSIFHEQSRLYSLKQQPMEASPWLNCCRQSTTGSQPFANYSAEYNGKVYFASSSNSFTGRTVQLQVLSKFSHWVTGH
ncbi:MAG: hypothetical protein U0930_11175 [Pirellulales bacterium]